jgi:hypothetical protein
MALIVAVKAWLAEHYPGYSPPYVASADELPTPACTESGDEVPWCEVYLAGTHFNGVCSWCVQLHHKDD